MPPPRLFRLAKSPVQIGLRYVNLNTELVFTSVELGHFLTCQFYYFHDILHPYNCEKFATY